MALFENEKTRTVFWVRAIEFSKMIRIVTETESYFVTDTTWKDIVSDFQDREEPGVRAIAVDDNVLIITIDTEKMMNK